MSIMPITAMTVIMAIMAVKAKVRYVLSYGGGKNEFPGKRYNASNQHFVGNCTPVKMWSLDQSECKSMNE